jgi:protocatechuate 3,4-dioxygenase beta subunit
MMTTPPAPDHRFSLSTALWILATAVALDAQNIRGRVIGAGGQPHDGARLELVPSALQQMPGRPGATPILIGKSDEKGRFSIDASMMAPDVEYQLFVTSDAFLDRKLEPLVRPAGKEQNLGDIELEPGAVWTGTILDPGAKPIRGVTVRFFPRPDRPVTNKEPRPPGSWGPRDFAPSRWAGWAARTDAKGRYRLAGVRMGKGVLSAWKPGWIAELKNVQSGPGDAKNKPQDFALRPGTVMSGVVLDPNGKPIEGVRILQTRSGPRHGKLHIATRSDARGRFNLQGLDDDRELVVYAHAPGFLEKYWILGRRKKPSSKLELRSAPVVRVRVKTKDGRTPARYFARIIAANTLLPETPFQTITAVKGIGSVVTRRSGPVFIEVRIPDHAPTLNRMARAGDGEPTTDIVMTRGGGIRGVVLDRAGKPVANAELELRVPLAPAVANMPGMAAALRKHFDQPVEIRTDAAGKYEVRLLRPQAYRLVTNRAGFVQMAYHVEIREGNTHQMKPITLHPGVVVRGKITRDGEVIAAAKIVFENPTTKTRYEARANDKGEYLFPKPIPPGLYEAMACSPSKNNPFAEMSELRKNRCKIVIPFEKVKFTLDFPLRN